MARIDLTKAFYFLDGLSDKKLSKEIIGVINSLIIAENLYSSATREITTKLENLNEEFKHVKDRNPIHIIKARVKTPRSIIRKLSQRGFELSVESARENLTDIAGVRVICSYIDDVYLIADLLTSQDDIEVIRRSDYIKEPKRNGYRSLHLIVTVPVFLSESTELVKVEVQIRTIAMDLWASLEHELSYKLTSGKPESVTKELKDCADIISNIDIRMQNLYNVTLSKKPDI
ncbi:MAG TPA: GTP pyrophosphokinase family protein [Bacteroidales bacterium]|nr:GTP pyrophosphokinase family protein [Bacteroidales bacterium]HPR12989.1 GTP pyrophosphokinase family protein [Bacteroidales bacterium]HRW85354.1 GTP pyrophosphokinase family protein [Bacteroidales bacterium]